jgi:uncharacterized protein YxeA
MKVVLYIVLVLLGLVASYILVRILAHGASRSFFEVKEKYTKKEGIDGSKR